MKILIVDDNANNRMVLSLLLKDYGEDKNEIYEIDECENGLLAVSRCEEEAYDIVFMDIMMPEMDGIEATKEIRAKNKEVMIVAVSAVDDEARQKEILRNGAEDYVPKPIDAKLLNARLDNYFPLLRLRHQSKEELSAHQKAVNLYTTEIFKRQTVFYVSTEEALSEFWEYYLLREVSFKIDGLSDVVRAIFSLGEAIIALKGELWIIVEGDNDATYFTMNRIDVVGEMVVKLIMKKNKEVKDFKFNGDKISFKLLNVVSDLNTQPSEVKSVESKESPQIAEVAVNKEVHISTTDVQSYAVFDFMDADDLAEVQEQIGDLSSLMLMLGSSSLELSEITQIAQYLERLGRSLSTYSESYVIGQALINLSSDVASHADRFQEIASDLSSLSSAFVSDLETWTKMIFSEGAPSVDFMDDTIVANTQTISSMLSVDESAVSEEDMDDIFDF